MTPTLRAAGAAALALGAIHCGLSEAAPEPASVLATMEKVGGWQVDHPSHWPLDDWTQGAGDTGMSALAALSGDPRFEQSLLQTGARLGWKPGPRPYHADDVVVGMAFEEMYFRRRDPALIAPLRARFDWVLANPPQQTSLDFSPGYGKATDLWSWCDSLFMAPPAWVRMGAATGNSRYTEYGVRNWWRTTNYLYDAKEHLFFRDSTYFQKREANGQKVFWSRGNGWVLAGLARMLEYLPANHPDRARFEMLFRDMAARVLSCQQADGLWRASLLDPGSYPMRETSGSGFFTFALAWGINDGLLPAETFSPAVFRGWSALAGCVGKDGRLGYVQPIGADPKSFPPDSTEPYGVGAFLLAGSEVYKMGVLAHAQPAAVSVTNPSDYARTDETVAVPAEGLDPSKTVVLDSSSSRVLDSQAWADDGGRAQILFK
ncbi:MAG TPA: glycoside hydrolase family 88 protein, partial [Opitutaceae bacterium]